MNKSQYPFWPILIVDDEPHTLASFDIALRTAGINNTIRCQDSREVLSLINKQEVGVLLLDLMMPHVSGQEILSSVKQDFPDIPVIIVSGINELDTAIQCMHDGAFDFVSKPVDAERLLPSVKRAIEMRQLRDENTRLARNFLDGDLEHPEVFSDIVTQSNKMQAIFKYCEAIAAGQAPILITGETGAGKELIAQVLHKLSGRESEMVAVNVAGVDDHVFSDTLFGHVRGAFTGADRARPGLIEKANEGTLFMDEIGNLNALCQVKLLRFLEEREYYPLGADIAKISNARIIVATHEDLADGCEDGQFRKDLYYRLRTHHVHVPPLRERLEDVPLLLKHFIEKAANDLGRQPQRYPEELIPHLRSYHFPGNIREFRSMVYDAVSRNHGEMLSIADFNAFSASGKNREDSTLHEVRNDGISWVSKLEQLPSLKEATRSIVDEAMRRTNNNQRAASLLLGITPQALNQRLKRL